jgi:hypothetical protein
MQYLKIFGFLHQYNQFFNQFLQPVSLLAKTRPACSPGNLTKKL